MTLTFVCSNHATPAKYDSLAQSVEHLTFNQRVRGSSPRWITSECARGGIGRRARLRIWSPRGMSSSLFGRTNPLRKKVAPIVGAFLLQKRVIPTRDYPFSLLLCKVLFPVAFFVPMRFVKDNLCFAMGQCHSTSQPSAFAPIFLCSLQSMCKHSPVSNIKKATCGC